MSQAIKQPATASWGLPISSTDLEKLKAGFRPQDQDDKWYYYVSSTEPPVTVHIVRSAFNYDMFVLHIVVRPGAAGAEIASLTWETNRGCLEEEQAKKEAVGITRSVLGCDFEGAPEYDG